MPKQFGTSNFYVLTFVSYRAIANYIVWRIVRNRINNLPIRFRDEMDVYRKVNSYNGYMI